MRRVVIFVISIATVFSLLFRQTRAQEAKRQGFAITPVTLKIKGNPGQRIQSDFSLITRNTTKTTKYSIEIKDLIQDDKGNIQISDIGLGFQSCADWVSVVDQLEVPPGESMNVPVAVYFPNDASPGNYYAFLKIKHIPETPSAKMAVLLLPALTLRIEATVLGKGEINVNVKEAKIVPNSEDDSHLIELFVSNKGVWKTSVEGDILLYKPGKFFPDHIYLPYKSDGKPIEIYPKNSVLIECPVGKRLEPGKYKADIRLLLNSRRRSVSSMELYVPKSLTGKSISGKILARSEYDLDISVEPRFVEVTLIPGAVRTIPIRIQNRDERTVEIRAFVTDAKMETDGSLTFPFNSQEQNEWISISPETISLAPKRTASIKAQIKVPRDTTGYSSFVKAVRINATGPTSPDGRQSVAEFGVLMVAGYPDSSPLELDVENPFLIYPFEGANPSVAVVTVKNKSGRAAKFRGKITLERKKGQVIAFMKCGEDQEEIILPGGIRVFRMPLPPIDRGDFRVKAEFVIPGSNPVWSRSETLFSVLMAMPPELR